MNELERRLRSSAARSPTRRRRAFDLGFERRPARRLPLRPLALGFAILLAVLAGVLAFSPGARSAFLEIFHLRGATVERVETLPQVEAQRIDFGERVSREEAERRVGFELVDLGRAGRDLRRGRRSASLVYGPVEKPRLVLSQAARRRLGRVHQEGRGQRHARSPGDGRRASPACSSPATSTSSCSVDANGVITDEQTYLAGTVLLWNRGPLLLRLEGDLTRAEALELASRSSREPVRRGGVSGSSTHSGGPHEEAPARARRGRRRRTGRERRRLGDRGPQLPAAVRPRGQPGLAGRHHRAPARPDAARRRDADRPDPRRRRQASSRASRRSRPARPASTTPSSGSPAKARTRTRSTTASPVRRRPDAHVQAGRRSARPADSFPYLPLGLAAGARPRSRRGRRSSTCGAAASRPPSPI